MVATKHCCYGDCKNDSRTLEKNSDIDFICFGNGFPKPNKETGKCKRWVQNCRRKYFTIDDVKKETYICSVHFVGGKGPTEEHPDPIKCGIEVVRTRKRPQERLPYKSPKQQTLEKNEAAEALLFINKPDTSIRAAEMPSAYGVSSTATVLRTTSTGVTCKPSLEEKASQTEKAATSDVVKLHIENRFLENNIKISSTAFLKKPNQQLASRLSSKLQDIHHFNNESAKNDGKMLKFYTGLIYLQFVAFVIFGGTALRN